MNKKIIWIVVVVIVIIAIIGFSSKSNNKPAGSKQIKIGAALSLSGIASADGEAIKNGIELARSELKAKGLNVEVIYQDDKTDPKETVSAINALNAQGVEAIIGPTWSYLADSGVPVSDRLKLVTVMPANTSEYVAAKSAYEFFTTQKVSFMVPTLADWLKSAGKKRIAIISNQGLWYQTIDKNVRAAAKEANVEIIYDESVPFGAAQGSMATIVAKIRDAKPDLIFTEIDEDASIIAFFNKSQQLGIKADVMSVTTALGRIITTGNINMSPGNSLFLIAPKTSDKFGEKYKAAYGTPAKPYSDRAYDSLMLLVDAIQNRGSMPLNEYLHTKTDYRGIVSNYKFDAAGDIGEGQWVVTKLK